MRGSVIRSDVACWTRRPRTRSVRRTGIASTARICPCGNRAGREPRSVPRRIDDICAMELEPPRPGRLAETLNDHSLRPPPRAAMLVSLLELAIRNALRSSLSRDHAQKHLLVHSRNGKKVPAGLEHVHEMVRCGGAARWRK
jgi:hypothetical protein